MRRQLLTVLVAVVSFAVSVSAQNAEMQCEADAVAMIGNTELSAELSAPGLETRVSGRMSLYLAASREDLEKGVVRVGGWNLAFFSVPQAPLSGVGEPAHNEGLLGFAATSREAALRVRRRKRHPQG